MLETIITLHYTVSFDDIWSTSVTEDEITEVTTIYEQQMQHFVCPNDFEIFLPIIALGKRYDGFPLMQYLFDFYTRSKLDVFLKFGCSARLYKYQPNTWLVQHQFGKRLKLEDPESFKLLVNVLRGYGDAKLFPSMVPASFDNANKVMVFDDLYKIFYYAAAAIKFTTNLSFEKHTPFQIEFTVLPKDISHQCKMSALSQRISASDIRRKLQTNECVMTERHVKDKDISSSEDILNIFNMMYHSGYKPKVKEQKTKGEKDYPKHRRFCVIVDRRERDVDKDVLFMFEPSTNAARLETTTKPSLFFASQHPTNDANHYLLPESYHVKSMECLVPGDHDLDDLHTRNVFGFTFSFHCVQRNQMKCYLWWNGYFMRFFPSDLRQVLPIWFAQNKQFIEDEKVKSQIEDDLCIKDLHFLDFIRALTLN